MEVTCVKAEELLVLHGISHIELMGADHIALAADPEELALHCVEVVPRIDRFGKNLVERGL